MADLQAPFARAQLSLSLLALDPAGLGGLVLRARSGPARDAVTAMLPLLPLPLVRLHPQVSDDALFGGLNLAATLASGAIVLEKGLISSPSALVLTMAERCEPQLGARLARVLDQSEGHCLIGLDEGSSDEEAVPPALSERCGFFVDMSDVALSDLTQTDLGPRELAAARDRLPLVRTAPDVLHQIMAICVQLGIDTLRAPLFALRAARASAALSGRNSVEAQDIEVACALTLVHRATRFPPEETEQEQDDTPPESDQPEARDDTLILPEELLIAAIRALLPADLLARIAATAQRGGKGSGTGSKLRGNRRGRPLPARAGRLGNGARIDLVATLRAAAPWQPIRRTSDPLRDGLHIRPADIRLKRFEQTSDRLLIFAVDASGSAALARLAEAKGAVELLLAQAYARRDQVALIAFRGTTAEVLLPPTRSLVQTKRRLAGLPGGGGTPLAAGLNAALGLADQARRRGLTPTLALLTDGRANIALDGRADRVMAGQDAMRLGKALRLSGIEGVVIDTGNRPEPALRLLSQTIGATYLPLPRADAARLSAAVSAALD